MEATAIRPCRDDERDEILAIVNAAAEVYHGDVEFIRHAYVRPARQGEGIAC